MLTIKARNQLFNEEYIMFFCVDAVFKVYLKAKMSS